MPIVAIVAKLLTLPGPTSLLKYHAFVISHEGTGHLADSDALVHQPWAVGSAEAG